MLGFKDTDKYNAHMNRANTAASHLEEVFSKVKVDYSNGGLSSELVSVAHDDGNLVMELNKSQQPELAAHLLSKKLMSEFGYQCYWETDTSGKVTGFLIRH